MSLYLLNMATKVFHDRRYYTTLCNLDNGIIGFNVAKTWREAEMLTTEEIRVYRYCKRCERQERYERGNAQVVK